MDISAITRSIIGKTRTSPTFDTDPTLNPNPGKTVSATRKRTVTPPAETEDEYFQQLRDEENSAVSRMNTDLENFRKVQREKDALKQAPVAKVPAWKRALAGALQNIGRQNPSTSWGEILGSGIGGAAVNAASPSTYERAERARRNSRIDEDFLDREQSAAREFEFDAKIADMARRRTDIASRESDRKAGREVQRQNAESQRLYREGIVANQKERNAEIAKENQRREALNKQKLKNDADFKAATVQWRAEGRKIQWDTLKEMKSQHEYERANGRGASVSYFPIEVEINGERRIQRVPVPDDVQDVKAYLEEVYAPDSAIGKGAKTIQPGVQAPQGRGKQVSGKAYADRLKALSEAAKQANASDTFKKGESITTRR